MRKINWIWSHLMSPISTKHLRLLALLIAIYQVLIAHFGLFIAWMGLVHAKQMKVMLEEDIQMQDDLGSYYEMRPYKNQARLFTASTLARVTEEILWVSTGISAIYYAACLLLIVGVSKNKSFFIVPWLIVYSVGIVCTVGIMVYGQNEKVIELLGGKTQYWLLCIGFTLFDSTMCYFIYAFYLTLREVNKLQEIATVAIPVPAPGMVPYHYRKENGSNGYKHILYDGDLENQKM